MKKNTAAIARQMKKPYNLCICAPLLVAIQAKWLELTHFKLHAK